MAPPLELDELQRLLWSFASHRVVTTAARVGILERLSEQAETPKQLAVDLGLAAEPTGKVVRALHALGLLTAAGGRYRVVPSLAPVLAAGDDSLGPFIEHSHRMYESWGENLEGWLRGGTWPRGPLRPDDTEVFGRAMRAMGQQVARRVAAALQLEDAGRMLDVGGGFGQFARVLCEENPELTAVVLDRPEVAELGRRQIAGSAVADRIEFVGGDYLTSELGSGFDLVLLANILHQEKSQDAASLVERSAAALAPGGLVAVVDFAIDDHRREHPLGTLFAINMRDFGDTWTESDIRGWMQAAALGHVERTDLGPDRWLLTGRASRLRRAAD